MTQSVELLKPVFTATSEVDCILHCLGVEICHLCKFQYKDNTCHMMKSVIGKSNLNNSVIVYQIVRDHVNCFCVGIFHQSAVSLPKSIHMISTE